MKEILNIINELKATAQGSTPEEGGYRVALEEVEQKITELTADKASRWAMIQSLFAIDIKDSMQEILKKRFR